MKQLFLSLIVLIFSITGSAQNAQQTKDGNYISISKAKTTAPAKNSGKTFTDSKGNKFPVMVSAKGKLYIIRTSKESGKEYKQYLKL